MITGAQIRMARGYTRWSVQQLAERSGVSGATIKRMEEADGLPRSITDNLDKIRKAFEAVGIVFTNGNEPGVRLSRAPAT